MGTEAESDSVETSRLLLRRWTSDDYEELAELFAKPDMWWSPFKRGWTAEETRSFLDRKLEEWGREGGPSGPSSTRATSGSSDFSDFSPRPGSRR